MAPAQHRVPWIALMVALAFAASGPSGRACAAELDGASLETFLRAPGRLPLRTGVLYDRVLPLSGIERFSGEPRGQSGDLRSWRQLADELRRAADVPFTPEPTALLEATRHARHSGIVPLAVLDARYERLDPAALATAGAMPDRNALIAALRERRAFALAPLVERTYRGERVEFVLDRAQWFSNDRALPTRLSIDFGDGRGERDVRFGEHVVVRYGQVGEQTLRLRTDMPNGDVREASTRFTVSALLAPTPDDTLHITATIPYQGTFGTGDAYVRLAPGHGALTNPVLLIEGFDLDNSMAWDELYALMNGQGLAESLAAAGFDAVVLNFTDSTEPVQKNGFVVARLIEQVAGAIDPGASLAVIGASMGGLCSRYALAYLESHSLPHRVRTWISFDTPHGGADIPLGLQYWVNFFAGQSADAALLRDQLNRPAARQMLLHHFTAPATNSAQPDPLRAGLLADFAVVGDFPSLTRKVAVINGSGLGLDQGFAPGDQLIRYDYSNVLAAATGNIWALRDQASQMIFDGRLRILFSTTTQQVTVSGAQPWNGAPGGSRASMAQMDSVTAPFGDIVALHPSHCFIPSVSALALATQAPFAPIAGDPDLLAHTPFDAVYVPSVNQEHVAITAENATWFIAEIERGLVGAGPTPHAAANLRAWPNPSVGGLRCALTLVRGGVVALEVFGVDGRRVRALHHGALGAGTRELRWDGRDDAGRAVPAGLYLLRLVQDDRVIQSQRIAHLN